MNSISAARHRPDADQCPTGADADDLAAALDAATSRVAVDLTQRFSAIEGSLAGSGLKELRRRTSPKGWPRLGGVIAKEATKHGVTQDDVKRAVERTVQASFLATWLAAPALAQYPRIVDEDAVWERWIATAYFPREDVLDSVMGIYAVEEFWKRAFDRWGMAKAHKQMSKVGSDVGRSLGGLSGVGITLAFAERDDVTAAARKSEPDISRTERVSRAGTVRAVSGPGPHGAPFLRGASPRRWQPAVARARAKALTDERPAIPAGLGFHDLRHTCAALLIAQGAHPKEIQERLGHSTIRLTFDRYGHLFPTLMTDCATDSTRRFANSPVSDRVSRRRDR